MPHIVLRGTFLPNTVRCDASYTYNQPSYLDPQHGAEYYSWTLEESTILYCFVDVRLGEYFVGSGPPTLTLVATHDLFVPSDGKPGSLAAFANLWERVLIEGGEAIPEEVIDNALGPGTSANLLDSESFVGREGIIFVSPLANKNVEAWALVRWWNIERKEDGTVIAVHPERNYRNADDRENFASQLEMSLPAFRQAVTVAHAERVTANGGRTRDEAGFPMLVSDANKLREFFVEVGAYDSPDDPPDQPADSYSCDSSTAVTNPGANRGLVWDCETLLLSKDVLRGTAGLDWRAGTTVRGWKGITVTDGRVAKLELANQSLSGGIPADLGALSALTHLDLSDNSLTGSTPRELSDLDNLLSLNLSGNSLTGCIPTGLRDITTNDLNSLNLLDCPPAPQNPRLAARLRISWRDLDTGGGQTATIIVTGCSH